MKKVLLLLLIIFSAFPIESSYLKLNELNEMNIRVDVRGHVKQEGIIELERGSTIEDCLEIAGLYETSSIAELNLSQILHDGDVLTISEIKDHLVHLNTATLQELMTLPGIGEKTAMCIIDYRTEHLFQSLDELMNVKGIGQKKYEALEGLIGL